MHPEFIDSGAGLLACFSGMLGVCPSGSTFLRPPTHTPKLSALIYTF